MEEIILGDNARSSLLNGINKLANTVKATLGPSGNTIIISDERGKYYNTKDGVSVANYIQLKDPIENIGAQMVKEAAQRTVEMAGDATTTSTVLSQSLINEGVKFLNSGGTYNELKNIFNTSIPIILRGLKDQAKIIYSDNVTDVATVSANNDVGMGEFIQMAFTYSNVVKVVKSDGLKDSLEYLDGIRYPVTYMSKTFVTNESKNSAEQTNPKVLLLDCKLYDINNIAHILKYCNENKHSLTIISEFISDDVIKLLETNHINGAVKVLAVKSPGYSSYRREYLKDIAAITGSTIVTDTRAKCHPNVLGDLNSITAKVDETIMIPNNESGLDQRLNELFSIKNDTKDSHAKKVIEDRIENLGGKISIINVGAKSENELSERFDRYDDAVLAVTSALEEGVVTGGGIALWNIAENNNLHYVFDNTLRYPNKVINDNGADVDPKVKLDSNIVDPVKVTRCAFENAASVALTILGTEGVVLNKYLW